MQKDQHFNGRLYETQLTIPAGQSRDIRFAGTGPATIAVHAPSATATVSFSISPADTLGTADERFFPATNLGQAGVITHASDYEQLFTPLTALRVAAANGPVVVEVLQ